jgi:hypothetical protein
MDAVQRFVAGDPEPEVPPGTLAVVNQGDYRYQEVWVASGSNIGNWYPLGGEHWVMWRRGHIPAGVTKQYPTWDDVTARGPVTLMVPSSAAAYRQGWADGRARLLEQIEDLRDAEPVGEG